jgi:putative NADPH-quinone reductase
MTRIALIQGHPTADARHFCHALADAYRKGAEEGGHELRDVDVAKLQYTVLRSRKEWEASLWESTTRERAGASASRGRAPRIVVTMGMPALIYRWYFGAHGLKSFEQGILSIVGIRERWLETIRALGRAAR